MGVSFQVSNTSSGDGFKSNSRLPINTQAEREFINCLTMAHFEKEREKNREGKKRKYQFGMDFPFYNPSNYKQKLK